MLLAVLEAVQEQRTEINRLNCEMRGVRHARWRVGLATLWQDRPGVTYHWLHAAGAPWGSTPILDETGMQCTSVATVDAAVRSYWVDAVLQQHALVDPDARWAAFAASRFGSFIPTLTWPETPWTGARVRDVLRRMREAASPGMTGIPIVVWRALPDAWQDAVACMLQLVEDAGTWPTEWLHA